MGQPSNIHAIDQRKTSIESPNPNHALAEAKGAFPPPCDFTYNHKTKQHNNRYSLKVQPPINTNASATAQTPTLIYAPETKQHNYSNNLTSNTKHYQNQHEQNDRFKQQQSQL